jgi:hypothetical protein
LLIYRGAMFSHTPDIRMPTVVFSTYKSLLDHLFETCIPRAIVSVCITNFAIRVVQAFFFLLRVAGLGFLVSIHHRIVEIYKDPCKSK